MMNKRDNFLKKVTAAVAARAGWHCSFDGCHKLTVGPSGESPDAIAKVGDVAHICAAAPGPGARRYDPSMTREERSGIGNAIWLCNDHARWIDRDEVTYTADILRAMKRRHESEVALAVRVGAGMSLGRGLFAIGPEVVCTGDVSQVAKDSWTLDLAHFVTGDLHTLVSFIGRFAEIAPGERYVLSNELGDGRVIERPPSLQKQARSFTLTCPVLPPFRRLEVQKLGSRMASHPETGDVYLDAQGNIARVSGLDALPQSVQNLLSMQRGESPFYPTSGVRSFEYFDTFQGSPWLGKLLMLDVIRQVSIPYIDRASNSERLPIRCVDRVHSVELLADTPVDHRLPVRVDFDVTGVGRWQREVSVYMPTEEQMQEATLRQASLSHLWQ